MTTPVQQKIRHNKRTPKQVLEMALISIAHPDDREWLEREAHRGGLLPAQVPRVHAPQGRRRPPLPRLPGEEELQNSLPQRLLRLRLGPPPVREIRPGGPWAMRPRQREEAD